MAAHVRVEVGVCCLLILSFLSISADVLVDDEFEGVTTFTVEHSFDLGPNPEFTKRGSVTVKSLKGGRAQFSKPVSLSSEERSRLRDSVSKNGLYRIRIPLRKPDPSLSIQHVSTATKACALFESRLSDHLTINVDQAGEILGVSMVTYPGLCTGQAVNDSGLEQFNSTVEIVQPVNGPTPDTQNYIEKMKKEEQEKIKGAQGDNRSFFAKYWMYIVPVFIFMLIASGTEQNAGGR
ncbi:ER membrane protein complex subunit 10-like [Liolophura sinensis]|uniref:ER membrane protein complex subunit 10-like n=1 Tax=Liolophura sinensis TaxID=3198878 RepID=UPI003158D0DE